MKQKITDIANMVKVSPATVSNALNHRKGVSEKTKKAVLKAAGEIGYHRNKASEGLRRNIKLIVFKKHGFVVSETPFFAALIEGIEKECRVLGYEMGISHINTKEKNYEKLIDDITLMNASGILLLATEMGPDDLDSFKNIDIPIILLDGNLRNYNYNSVLTNNSEAAYTATKYLFESGHINIGYLHSSVYINNFHERKWGYKSALEECGIGDLKEYEILLEPTIEGSYMDLGKFLQNNRVKLPTAFFADNDIIAFGAMKAFKEAGIKIPQDISIIGIDDMPVCEITNPRLTTVKVFKQEMGSIAVKMMDSILNEKRSVTQKIELGTELVQRDSVIVLKNKGGLL